MLKHIPNTDLYHASHGWLESRFHFSFAEYHNPKNHHYGVLRVMNDDTIEPHTGFDTHPHRDMEIITYIINGHLSHQDSMGHKETLSRGDVQYLSAGTGITHSEKNESNEALHLIQLWILPEKKGLRPQYGSKRFLKENRQNRWLHIVGNGVSTAPITIYQDANIYASELEAGQKSTFLLEDSRQCYLKVMEGNGIINTVEVNQGDALECDETFTIHAQTSLHLLVVEMPKQS